MPITMMGPYRVGNFRLVEGRGRDLRGFWSGDILHDHGYPMGYVHVNVADADRYGFLRVLAASYRSGMPHFNIPPIPIPMDYYPDCGYLKSCEICRARHGMES